MTFKQAVKAANRSHFSGDRYIMRRSNGTLFDVVQYHPSHLEDEDIWADDWSPIDLDEVKDRLS